jgi:hypothetical protein
VYCESLQDSPIPGTFEDASCVITHHAKIHFMESHSKVKQVGWNKIIHSQTKEVIYNVCKFMKQKAEWESLFLKLGAKQTC